MSQKCRTLKNEYKEKKEISPVVIYQNVSKNGFQKFNTVLWVKGEVWQSSRGFSSHHSDSDSEGSIQENRNSDSFTVLQIQMEVFWEIEIQISLQ